MPMPPRLRMPVRLSSYDGRFYPRWPGGDRPATAAELAAAAQVVAAAGGDIQTAIRLAGDALSSSVATGSAGGGAAWQLASGHYEPSKAEPIIVYPRSDANSHSSERHRLAPAGRRWRIPVAMYSGSWPFQYSVDATSVGKGITIGAQLTHVGDVLVVGSDYAELSWDNPTIGSHTITVTVRDQEYGRNTSGFSSEKIVKFTLVVAAADDITKFVWISGTGNDTTGAGTPASPFRTLSKVFNSTAYNGRQLHALAGSYNTTGSGNMAMNYTSPAVFVADAGAAVTVDLTQYPFIYSADGCYTEGVEFTDGGYGATVADSRIFTVNAGVDNFHFHRCRSTNPSNGTSGGDNPSFCFSWGGGTARLNCSFTRCVETGRPYSSNAAGLYVLFACDQGASEFNTISGNARYNAILKDSNQKWSVRCNDATGLGGSAELAFGTGCQLQSYTTQDIEISYNKSAVPIRFNYQATSTSGVHHIFRNSIPALEGWNTSTGTTGPYNIDKNAITGSVVTGSRVITTNTECHNASALDASKNLQGTYRTNYLGTRAAEVI